LRGHYNQKLLCGKKKKVEHASRARFDRLGGVTGSGVKHVNRQLIKLARDRVRRQCNKGRRREDGQSAPDPIRATPTTHGCDLGHALYS
jgi:hypothetical protein